LGSAARAPDSRGGRRHLHALGQVADALRADLDWVRELVVREKALNVATLSSFMREIASASLLVLDTAFPDPTNVR
jgi:hypothetical protein